MINRRAQGIDVAPGTLGAACIVLLRGSVAGLQNDRHAALAVHGKVSRRAEINQLDLQILAEHDIGGAQVAVDQAVRVNLGEGDHGGLQHVTDHVEGHGSVLFAVFPERDALDIFHHDVGCVIFLENVTDPDDMGVVGKLGEEPGFFHEALLLCLKQGFLRAGIDGQERGVFGNSGHEPLGVVFFDGDFQPQLQVAAGIRDAEAALSDHAADVVAAGQNRADRQLKGIVPGMQILPAGRTYIRQVFIRQILHTMRADHRLPH